MKPDFCNYLSNLTADSKSRSKVIACCLKNWPQKRLSVQEKSLVSMQVQALFKALQHEIDGIDITNKNKLWRYDGAISIPDGLAEVKESMTEVKRLIAKDEMGAYQCALAHIRAIDRNVKELQVAQKQSAIVNWFTSRIPGIVR